MGMNNQDREYLLQSIQKMIEGQYLMMQALWDIHSLIEENSDKEL